MSNSFFPTQIGFIPPSGNTGQFNISTVVLGGNAGTTWEAVAFGAAGRPDYLETLYINLSKQTNGIPTRIASISLNVSGVQAIIAADSNAGAAALNMQIREVAVCVSGVAKNMMILASSPYT